MRDAEKVVKALRGRAKTVRDGWYELADFVEAAERLRASTPDYAPKAKDYDAALARLAEVLR